MFNIKFRNRTVEKFLIILLLSILILEGLGLPSSHLYSQFAFISLIPLLIILALCESKKAFSGKLLILFCILFIQIAFSALFSLNQAQSIRYLVYYLFLFLLFLYTINNREIVIRFFTPAILTLGVLFSIYSLIIKYLASYGIDFAIPVSGYQLIYPSFASHNHLGDFLVLSLLLSIFHLIKTKNMKYMVLALFYLPFILLSFSRSAYLSLIVTLTLMILYFLKKKIIGWPVLAILILPVIICTIFFFSVIKDLNGITPARDLNQFMYENLGLKNKYLYASRPEYLRQAFLSSIERPVFGVGPGNFIYASIKHTNNPRIWSFSSHNIFLDILVENGILALIVFALIILLIFKTSNANNPFFYLFVAMVVNFQTDYAFTIFSYLALFFMIMALTYQSPNDNNK